MTQSGPASRIAAIVVTFNRLAQLEVTVARLLGEPVDHLIVVDSGSTDGTHEHLAQVEDPRLHVLLLERNGGGAYGFEMGLREAVARHDPDWFVLMDDDGRPEAGAIAAFRSRPEPFDVLAAAVRLPSGEVCEMNRPWINPFWDAEIFIRTLFGGGRDAFHVSPTRYEADAEVTIHGASFVGLFLSRKAVQTGGFPDGRMFIYGDDVFYTLGLTQAGLHSVFSPHVRFQHDCRSLSAGAVFRPLWKTYYHHRNLWRVYRRAAGPVLFWPLMALMIPKWLAKSRRLEGNDRRVYAALVRLGISDALRNKLDRPHAEILRRAEEPCAP